jgi:uncharacterized membrane protein
MSLVIGSLLSGLSSYRIVTAKSVTKGNVHGTLIDENGEPIENVEITIYYPSGNIEKIYTNGSGYFRLALDGKNTLVFAKDGYSSVTREINVPQELWENAEFDPVKMGEIVLGPALELQTKYLDISEELGRTIDLPITVSNGGENDEIIELYGESPDEWSISFSTETKLTVERFNLYSGEFESFTLEITPSEDADVGDYTVTVYAASKSGLLESSLKLLISLREASSDVEIIGTFTDIRAEAGESFKFPLTIWNKGTRDSLMLLAVVQVPENWDAVFVSDDIEASNFLVEAGHSVSLQLEVTPPSIVKTGEYPIIIVAESDDGLISETISLQSTIVGSYDLDIELSTLYTTVNIGDTVTFQATIRNRGQSAITGIFLDYEGPEEWDTSVEPVQIATLSSRDSSIFNIEVETPSDTASGDYLITIKASGDQVDSDETQIRITAKASTSWGFIGLGIAIASVIILVLVFMRFKRR